MPVLCLAADVSHIMPQTQAAAIQQNSFHGKRELIHTLIQYRLYHTSLSGRFFTAEVLQWLSHTVRLSFKSPLMLQGATVCTLITAVENTILTVLWKWKPNNVM